MPRFYIDSNDDDFHLRDEEAQDFPSLAAARDAAMMLLPDMAREKLPDGDQRVFCVNVRDEQGIARYTATLSLVGEGKDGDGSSASGGRPSAAATLTTAGGLSFVAADELARSQPAVIGTNHPA